MASACLGTPMRTSAHSAMLADAIGATTVRLWEKVHLALRSDLLEVVRDTTYPAHAVALLRRSR